MSDTINHQPTVTLIITRCYDCGRFWAFEHLMSADCPVCARNNKNKRFEALEHAERTISSLRGALTKAKATRIEGKQKRAKGARRV